MVPLCSIYNIGHCQTLPVPATGTVKATVAAQSSTSISGRVVDAATGKPLGYIAVAFSGSKYGTNTTDDGRFSLKAGGIFKKAAFSFVGYQTVTITLTKPEQTNILIRLKGKQTQLKEVVVSSAKKQHYTNKGNPAVELIQKVIDHKEFNRPQSTPYLQYDQYERVGLSLIDLPKGFINSSFFKKYQFMLDSSQTSEGRLQKSLPVFFSEKLYKNYLRREPAKSVQILTAQKELNILKFIDTVGVAIYINRLYGNSIDIYSNNIFIISNQFLSPIADHAPNYYKFFITDTIQTPKGKLVRLSYTPRNGGDILFEGNLLVTLDGNYAVAGCELDINRQININFMRNLKVHLDFDKYPDKRYYLTKSDVKADFGISKTKGAGVTGERTVNYSNYVLDKPLPLQFYDGSSNQVALTTATGDSLKTLRLRDTLSPQQAKAYRNIERLQNMPSFKRTTWIVSAIVGGYADVGPVQIGQIGDIYGYNHVEGSRFQLGGRTTPKFNQTIYLEGYGAYGLKDKQFKYSASGYIALNKTPFYRFPNDYFKLSYDYDISIPGKSLLNNSQPPLSSFQNGKNDYFLYSRTFRAQYVRDLASHFSYDVGVRNWTQHAAGNLIYQFNNAAGTLVNDLTTSEATLRLRYAPHEQIIQGTVYRRTIHSKYPIYTLQINQGFKGVFNGSYQYTNITGNIYKRFYLSQLGYTDVTLLGNLVAGQVPFPLLSIIRANQSLDYEPNAYNKMYYLEFVADHYVGLNFTQSFNGFFLNKVPLIKHLKWREFLSFKALKGGVRDENNPALTANLYRFPQPVNGASGTYALGKTPYIEAGAGIGNIFKLIRVDVIRRFNYLDHPGITPYGVKFSFSPDL